MLLLPILTLSLCSGFLVVRCGEVVHRSQEQQHYFNTPFQLSLPPTELQSEVSVFSIHSDSMSLVGGSGSVTEYRRQLEIISDGPWHET
jgi:hypothetical protein